MWIHTHTQCGSFVYDRAAADWFLPLSLGKPVLKGTVYFLLFLHWQEKQHSTRRVPDTCRTSHNATPISPSLPLSLPLTLSLSLCLCLCLSLSLSLSLSLMLFLTFSTPACWFSTVWIKRPSWFLCQYEKDWTNRTLYRLRVEYRSKPHKSNIARLAWGGSRADERLIDDESEVVSYENQRVLDKGSAEDKGLTTMSSCIQEARA